jgi:hypothetical protein
VSVPQIRVRGLIFLLTIEGSSGEAGVLMSSSHGRREGDVIESLGTATA